MKSSISKKIFGSLFEIRKGEYAKTILMFSYILLVLTAYYIIKPVRNSLFLTKFDADSLPYVWILVAIIVGGIAYAYSKLLKRVSLNVLISWTFGVLLTNLIAFRWLFTFDWPWMAYVFYVWVSIFSILATSQFWLLANNIFNAREAKRLFGFIGTGAVTGAAFGGTLTSLLVKRFGTDNMLYFCMAVLALAWTVYAIVWRLLKEKPEKSREEAVSHQKPESTEGIFALIRNSRHLLLLVGIIGLTLLCSNFVDFQFNKVVQRSFDSKDALTAFFGKFFLFLNIFAFILQFFFTGSILRKLGVGATIMFLPVSLLAGAGAMIFAPVLASAIFLKISEGGFRYSINRSGLELLYLPVPSLIKNKTKAFIDMFVDRFTRGISGGLLLLFTAVLSFNLRVISIVVILFIFGWIFLVILIKREYVQSLRKAIYKGGINRDEIRFSLHDATSIRVISETLETGNEQQVLYALSLLEDTDTRDVLPALKKLLSHPAKAVRARVLDMLSDTEYDELKTEVEKLLDDDSMKVRVKALRCLYHSGKIEQRKRLLSLLKDEDHAKRAVAIACLAQHGTDEDRESLRMECCQEILARRKEIPDEAVEEIAGALGCLAPDSDLIGLLPGLMEDKSVSVVAKAIESTGRLQKREHVLILVEKLALPSLRRVSRHALASYGDRVLGTLRDIMCDDRELAAIRMEIPKVLFLVGTQEAVDRLVSNLGEKNLNLRFQIIKALSKLRDRNPGYTYDDKVISEAIVHETREYFSALILLNSLGEKRGSGLLWATLEEQLEKCYERISRLTALLYPAGDLLNTYHGLRSEDKARRANSLELLDNVLDGRHKKFILPIVEDASVESKIRKGMEFFALKQMERDETLRLFMAGNNRWLTVCALQTAGELRLTSLTREVENNVRSPDTLIQETASRALRLIAGKDIVSKEDKKMMTDIEKVMYLRGVDVFNEVAAEKLLLIASLLTEKTCKKGEIIYSKGDYVDSMYFVVAGKVRYEEAKLDIGEREPIGAAELFSGDPRPTTAVVTEDAHLLRVDRETFFDLLDDYMEIAHDIFKALARRLKQLHDLSLKSSAQKP